MNEKVEFKKLNRIIIDSYTGAEGLIWTPAINNPIVRLNLVKENALRIFYLKSTSVFKIL